MGHGSLSASHGQLDFISCRLVGQFGGKSIFRTLDEFIVAVGNAEHDALRLGIGDALGHGARFFRATAPMCHVIKVRRHGGILAQNDL
jgi:hypothetical protein